MSEEDNIFWSQLLGRGALRILLTVVEGNASIEIIESQDREDCEKARLKRDVARVSREVEEEIPEYDPYRRRWIRRRRNIGN